MSAALRLGSGHTNEDAMAPAGARNLRVLLVEDNPGDADLVRDALAPHHHVVLEHVERLRDALNNIATNMPDVVLLDLSLPDAHGLSGLSRLRVATPQIAVVVLTSLEDDRLGALAVAEGAQDYLVKGQITGPLLHRALWYAVERQRFVQASAELLDEERSARARAERAEARAVLLAEISRLLVSSLEVETVLEQVARLVAERLCTWCSIDLIPPDGDEPERLVVSHAKDEILRQIRSELPPPERPAGHFVFLPELSPDSAAPHLWTFAPSGVMIAPISGRHRVLGAITFIQSGTTRRFDEQDLALAEEIARRATVAVENARLYQDARAAIAARDEFLSIASHELRTPLTALTLQLAMMKRQTEPAQQPKLERATRSTLKLEHLVNALFEVSRLTKGDLSLHREKFDLSLAARLMVDSFHEVAALGNCSSPSRGRPRRSVSGTVYGLSRSSRI